MSDEEIKAALAEVQAALKADNRVYRGFVCFNRLGSPTVIDLFTFHGGTRADAVAWAMDCEGTRKRQAEGYSIGPWSIELVEEPKLMKCKASIAKLCDAMAGKAECK